MVGAITKAAAGMTAAFCAHDSDVMNAAFVKSVLLRALLRRISDRYHGKGAEPCGIADRSLRFCHSVLQRCGAEPDAAETLLPAGEPQILHGDGEIDLRKSGQGTVCPDTF